MEHNNHCSVFSCQGSLIRIRVRRKTDFSILLWCILNYALHLGVHFAGLMDASFKFPDAALVVLLEMLMVTTGIFVLRNRTASESARSFGSLLFASNALFLLFLFEQLITRGAQGLDALIRL